MKHEHRSVTRFFNPSHPNERPHRLDGDQPYLADCPSCGAEEQRPIHDNGGPYDYKCRGCFYEWSAQ